MSYTGEPCRLQMTEDMLVLVAARFHTLGEPYRLRIFQVLRRGPMTVGNLVQALGGKQPNVSKHLQILRLAHLVKRTKKGTSVVYSLASPSVLTLCEMANRRRA